MNKTLSPKLRFPEFQDEWEGYFGNQLFDSISNKEHDSSLPVLAITQEHGAIPRDLIDYQVFVTDKSVASYKVVEVGDFIISLRSFQGGIEYSEYKGICSPAYIILRKKNELSEAYFKYFFKTERFIQQLQKNLEGLRDGKMVSYQQFSELLLPTPSTPEQQKIADCLTSLDDLIAAQSQKVEALQAYKKGLMQNLFPAEGESAPRLRFPEFESAGEWEREELGQLARDFLDGDWIESKDQSTNGIRLIQTGNVGNGNFISKNDSARYISEDTFYRLNCTEIFPGDCLISRLPDPIGRSCLLPDTGFRMITAVDCTIVRFDNQKIIPYIFVLYSQTNQYLDTVSSLGSGSTRKRISKENLSRMQIPIPSLPEQQRIAELLSAVDEEISAQGEALAALKVHKRGLMQGLFPKQTSEVLETSEV